MGKRKVHLPWGTGINDGLPGSRHPSPLGQDIVFCVDLSGTLTDPYSISLFLTPKSSG